LFFLKPFLTPLKVESSGGPLGSGSRLIFSFPDAKSAARFREANEPEDY
jgi:hypothetical protein